MLIKGIFPAQRLKRTCVIFQTTLTAVFTFISNKWKTEWRLALSLACSVQQFIGQPPPPPPTTTKTESWVQGASISTRRQEDWALGFSCEKKRSESKGEKERYKHLNAEFQRIARRDKKAFLSDQCKDIEENNRMGKTRYLFKKIRDARGN